MDKSDIDKLESLGYVADSKQVREELLSKVHNYEDSLENIQKILKNIQKTAKKQGLYTRKELTTSSLTLEQAIIIASRKKIIHNYQKLSDKLPPKPKEKTNKI